MVNLSLQLWRGGRGCLIQITGAVLFENTFFKRMRGKWCGCVCKGKWIHAMLPRETPYWGPPIAPPLAESVAKLEGGTAFAYTRSEWNTFNFTSQIVLNRTPDPTQVIIMH